MAPHRRTIFHGSLPLILLLFLLFLLLWNLPGTSAEALPHLFDISEGSIHIFQDKAHYRITHGKQQLGLVELGTPILITGATDQHSISVSRDTAVTVTLKEAAIRSPFPFRVNPNATLTLDLQGENLLGGEETYIGLELFPGTATELLSTDGSGSLQAVGKDFGIGGDGGFTLTLRSGHVTATGENLAGLGSLGAGSRLLLCGGRLDAVGTGPRAYGIGAPRAFPIHLQDGQLQAKGGLSDFSDPPLQEARENSPMPGRQPANPTADGTGSFTHPNSNSQGTPNPTADGTGPFTDPDPDSQGHAPLQPTGPRDILPYQGEAALLTVQCPRNASGSLSYQWYRKDSPESFGGQPIRIDGNRPYYAPDTRETGTSYYYVTLTDPRQPERRYSSPSAKVTVLPRISHDQGFPFTDVPESAWYHDAVVNAWAQNLMNGESLTQFEPQTLVTRGMISTVLWNIEGSPNPMALDPLPDFTEEWYINAVNWVREQGIVSGYRDGSFAPDAPITREELAVILQNYIRYKTADPAKPNTQTAGSAAKPNGQAAGDFSPLPADGGLLSGGAPSGQASPEALANLDRYSDREDISPWAEHAMAWANQLGILKGYETGTIRPQSTAIRGELAAILCNLLAEDSTGFAGASA